MIPRHQEPCRTFVLQDVICSLCSSCVAMDLLRDSHLMSEAWRCRQCGHSYDQTEIETSLLQIVNKYSLAYQIQDLVCEKCRLVKAENLPVTCLKCAGKFLCKEPQEEFYSRHAPLPPSVSTKTKR